MLNEQRRLTIVLVVAGAVLLIAVLGRRGSAGERETSHVQLPEAGEYKPVSPDGLDGSNGGFLREQDSVREQRRLGVPIQVPGAPADDERGRLLLRGTVRGRVVWLEAPTPGASVGLFRSPALQDVVRSAVPDADGRFVLQASDPLPLFVMVVAQGASISACVRVSASDLFGNEGRTASHDVDIGNIHAGTATLTRITMVDPGTHEATSPADFWLLHSPQSAGLRGLARSGSDAGVVPSSAPLYLGRDPAGRGLEISLNSAALGGFIVGISESFAGSHLVGSQGTFDRIKPIAIRGSRWCSLQVRVTASGQPVEGCSVAIFPASPGLAALLGHQFEAGAYGSLRTAARTGSEGTAELIAWSALFDTAKLLVSHPRYGARSVGYEYSENAVVAVRLTQPWTPGDRRVRFLDDSGRAIVGLHCELSGRVLDQSDDAWFYLGQHASYPVPPVLAAEGPGHAPYRSRLDGGDWSRLDITLPAVGRLEVRVRDDTGMPIPGSLVALSGPRPFHRTLRLVSDEDGLAVFDDAPLVDGRRIEVTPPSPRSAWEVPGEDELASWRGIPAGQQVLVVTLRRVDLGLGSLTVRAVDWRTGEREPLARLLLTRTGKEARRFWTSRDITIHPVEASVANLLEGSYLVWVSTLSGKRGVVPLQAGADAAEISCPVGDPLRVHGRLRSSSSARAPSYERISVSVSGLPRNTRSPDERVWPTFANARPDESGRFVLEGLMPCLYQVRVLDHEETTRPSVLDASLAAGASIDLEY